MSAETTIASVEHEGFTVESTGTAEQIKESLQPDKPAEEEKPDISKAASDLGKRGGEAAAKAKAKAAREAKKEAKSDDEARSADARGSESDSEKPDGESEPDPVGRAADSEERDERDSKRGNPRHDPTARVAEATRQAKEARERAERAEREAAEYRYRYEESQRQRQEPAQTQEQPQATPQDDPDEPQEGDFEFHKDYVKALARHEYNKAAKEAQRQAIVHHQAAAYVQRVTAAADTFKAALNKAAEVDPEIRSKISPEVMGLGPSWMLEPGVKPTARNWIADQLLRKPEKAAAIMLHLSENPAEFQRIATLSSPSEITWELAMITSRSDAATAGTSVERRVSKANPPPSPVGGSPAIAGASSQGPRPGETFDQWLRRTGGK